MGDLKLYLFGPPRVELSGRPVDLQRRKAMALLIYLAVSGQPHSRDALATLFWPDHDQSRARAYLRRDLAVINTSLPGDWLVTDRDTVELQQTANFWLDVAEFRRSVAECQNHDHPAHLTCPDCLACLIKAANLYTDDFLAGFTLRDSAEFDDWQFFQAESLRQELASVLERLVHGLSNQGDYEAAVPFTRRWLALDPLHEPAQRQLIQLYDQAGQPSAALRQYEEYVKLLEEELGLPPEEETTTLYEAIKAKRLLSSYLKAERQSRGVSPAPSKRGQTGVDERLRRLATPPPPAPAPVPDQPLPVPAIPLALDRAVEVAGAVGRDTELEQLQSCLNTALQGVRQLVFVTGEPGLGKTTLVEAFLEQARTQAEVWIGLGQCIEHRGAGEAYMPVLTAFSRLCQEPGGQDLITLLERVAPTWLVQMPWLLGPEGYELLRQKVQATTRERMLREMVEAVEIMTAKQPLILVLEDLHWSDYSTLDLLIALAQRQERARLLLIGTYRPAEVNLTDHPLHTAVQKMQILDQCTELSLSTLSESAVGAYLAGCFPDAPFLADLLPLLYRRTGGNPLFMRAVLDAWLVEGLLAREGQQWRLPRGSEALTGSLPDNLRRLIELQLLRLETQDRQILEAASVVGMEFSAAAVAAAVDLTEEEVESRCDTLARQGQFLQPGGIAEWPDGTVAEQFEFSHHLYQEVLYERVPAGRRARLHRRIGERLEAGYGSRGPEMGAELALHFGQGRDPQRAVKYLRFAAEQALRLNAPREAINHLTAGLELLQRYPDLPERSQHELALQTLLAPALIVTRGWAAPEAEQAYLRADKLSRQLGDMRQLSLVLYGLATLYELRGEYPRSQALLEERLKLLADPRDQRSQLESHELLACATFHQGAFAEALNHADLALTFCNFQQSIALTPLLGENPAVSSHHWAGLSLWFMGYPDQALARSRQALSQSKDLLYTFSLAHAQEQAAMLHHLRREEQAVYERAEATIAAATRGGFAYWVGVGQILRGWALAIRGQVEQGIDQIREGMEICQATGTTIDHPYFLTMLAEACGRGNQIEAGLEALDQALMLAGLSEAFFYEAELHRLRGVLLLQANPVDNLVEAEANFQRALTVARRQQTKSLELRAALSLARLWQSQQKTEDACRLLEEIYGWFTEGFETADLQEAKALIEELGGKVEQGRRGAGAQPFQEASPRSGEAKPVSPLPVSGWKLNQQIHYCTTPDKVRLAYAIAGSGPPLVKAANWLSHLEYDWQSPVWRHWLAGLARHHTLIRYDERGCGLSDWEIDDFSFEAWVRDLETVVEAAGLERFSLLGISQGVAIAIAYAVRHPEKVSRLILYGGYARGRLKRDLMPEQLEETQTFLQLIKLGWGQENPAFRQVFTTLFIPDASLEQQRGFNDLQRISTSPENAMRLVAGFGTVDVRHLAAQVNVPTLVLHAKDDARIPFDESQLVADLIPGARLVPLESRNHILLEHEPAWLQFLEEVHRFLGVDDTAPANRAAWPEPPSSPVELPPPPATLPLSSTPFVGREKELAEIRRLLLDPDGRLITLVGPGGIGKTRLALEAATQVSHTFAQSVRFVPLAPLESPEAIVATVAEALAFRFYEGDDPKQQLLDYLHGRQLLLIMDNFEHVLAGAGLVAEMLQAAPQLKIIVTSRERLNLSGETIYALDGLTLPAHLDEQALLEADAIKLLTQQARFVRPDFTPEAGDLTAMARIGQLTQGMPLALVLATGWLEVLSWAEIAGELAHSLDILETTARDAPERQRSMRAAFDYSWQHLSPEEQQVFAKLSVFRGGFTREAAQAVAGASLRTLRTLVNKSLVKRERENLYEVHELLRQYAAEHLACTPEAVKQTQDAHCAYYCEVLADWRIAIMGGQQVEALAEIEAELDNIRVAWQWAVEQGRVDDIHKAAAPTLALFYQFQSRYLEGLETFEKAAQVLSKLPETEPRDLALINVLMSQSWFCLRFGRLETVEALMAQSQAIYQRLNIPPAPGYVTDPLIELGFVALIRGDYEQVVTYAEQVRQTAMTHQHRVNHQLAYHLLGEAALGQHQYDLARQYTAQAHAIAEQAGDRWAMAYDQRVLGNIASAEQDYAAAQKYYEASYALRLEFNDRGGVASIVNRLGYLALLQENYAEARRSFEQSLVIYQELSDKGGLVAALSGLGRTALALGDYPAAWQYLRTVLPLAVELGYAQLIGAILAAVSELWFKTGQPARGAALLTFVRDYPALDPPTQDKVKELERQYGPTAPPEGGASLALGQVVAEVLAAPLPSTITPAPGSRFVQEQLIATGGMGEVYLGRDTHTGQTVAIKRLRADLAAHNPEAVKRLLREGEVLSQLNHPNIVHVLATMEEAGQPVIVMEYVSGGTLEDLLRRQPHLPLDRILTIALELADALTRVHHLGILHRDLKPANILLTGDGAPRLTDFGVAYLARQEATRLTKEGAILGTSAYLSPEAWRGQSLDTRSDIWSFGAVLYELLAGRPPFAAETVIAVMTSILHDPLPDLTHFRPDTPPALIELLKQMLVKERDQRIDSMRQVAAGLEVIRRSVAG